MPVPTTYTITAKCGHEYTFSLASVRAGLRATVVRSRENEACPPCRASTARTAAYAQDVVHAEAVERDFALPDLSGPDRQMRYARIYRAQMLERTYDVYGGNDAGLSAEEELERHCLFEAQVLVAARRITSATWWCVNRHADSENVSELVNSMKDVASPGH